jgi:hypothetical protein
MKLRKIILGVVCSIGFLACTTPPLSTSPTNNEKFTIDKLFTHDNCTIYRFSDGGNYIYYADCSGNQSSSTLWNITESCGKNCVHVIHYQVITEE